MAYFKDADEVYAYIGKLFEQLAEDEELAPKFRKANTIVQYQYREPESQITVKLIEGEDGQVDCGETTMEPEVIMTMEADTAHRFWLGLAGRNARAQAFCVKEGFVLEGRLRDAVRGPGGDEPAAGPGYDALVVLAMLQQEFAARRAQGLEMFA